MSNISVHAQRDDCTRLTSGHVVLPNFTCAIPKEALFHVFDRVCNDAINNVVIRQLLDNFVQKVIKGIYTSHNDGKHTVFAPKQGDFVRLILTYDEIIGNPREILIADLGTSHLSVVI